jgi:4-hydroxy-tetrahydrodipicolinate synthase
MIHNKLRGTGVAIVTPFRRDYSIDFPALERLLKYLLENRVNYIVVLGTTGESATLNKDEKKALLNFVIDYVDKKVPVVAGFGGNNTREIVSSIKHYNFTGIDAVLSVAPYYNKPTQKGLLNHYKEISIASPVPVILYNVPGRTGVNIAAETTLELAHKCTNIIAVKEASGNFEQMMHILRDKPEDFMLISGEDTLTLPMISMGASGVISVTANAFPQEYGELVQLALKGKFPEAMKIQSNMLEIMQTLFIEGNPAGIKAALKIKGILENYFRPPLEPVSRQTYNKLVKLIDSL